MPGDSNGLIGARKIRVRVWGNPVGPVMGRAVYVITEQALYFPMAGALQQHVYRYDIAARKGRWQERVPEKSTATRLAFQTGRLFGSSDILRQRKRPSKRETQPFGRMAIHLEQHETGYSHTYYNLGFPFGDSGWVKRHCGDETLELQAGRGNGRLRAAAFYRQTPEHVRREIIGKIARYDLSFNDKQHYFDACEAR